LASSDTIKIAKDKVNAHLAANPPVDPDQVDYAMGSIDFISPEALVVGNAVLVYLAAEIAGFPNYTEEFNEGKTRHLAEVAASGEACCCGHCTDAGLAAGDAEVVFFLENMSVPKIINEVYTGMLQRNENFLSYGPLLSATFTAVSTNMAISPEVESAAESGGETGQ